MQRRSLAVLLTSALCALVALAALPGATGAATPARSAGSTRPARLEIAVRLDRFLAHHRRDVASATATARLTNFSGKVTTVRQKVTLTAATGGSCHVLHLYLQQLDLKLLGLNAHLDKVVLDITGQAHGGVLGRLFCRLSQGVGAKLAAVRAANAALRRHPAPALRLRARISPQTAHSAQSPAPSCQILDLVLGPLNLNLLGLEVNLNQVHLSVTATPGGGVLGDLFCKLANGQT